MKMAFYASATHKNSHIINVLRSNSKIGLEVATNEFPYHGVRGKANVELMDGWTSKPLLDALRG